MAGDPEWERTFDRPASVMRALVRTAVYDAAIRLRQELNQDLAVRTQNVRAQAQPRSSSTSSTR